MAPKKKGISVNLRDLQREFGTSSACLPTAPRREEEKTKEDPTKENEKWSRNNFSDSKPRHNRSESNRWADREVDSDEDFPQRLPDDRQLNFSDVRSGKTQTEREVDFSDIRNQSKPQEREIDFSDIRNGLAKHNEEREVDFRNVRSGPTKARENSSTDFRQARSGPVKQEERDIDFRNVRSGQSKPPVEREINFADLRTERAKYPEESSENWRNLREDKPRSTAQGEWGRQTSKRRDSLENKEDWRKRTDIQDDADDKKNSEREVDLSVLRQRPSNQGLNREKSPECDFAALRSGSVRNESKVDDRPARLRFRKAEKSNEKNETPSSKEHPKDTQEASQVLNFTDSYSQHSQSNQSFPNDSEKENKERQTNKEAEKSVYVPPSRRSKAAPKKSPDLASFECNFNPEKNVSPQGSDSPNTTALNLENSDSKKNEDIKTEEPDISKDVLEDKKPAHEQATIKVDNDDKIHDETIDSKSKDSPNVSENLESNHIPDTSDPCSIKEVEKTRHLVLSNNDDDPKLISLDSNQKSDKEVEKVASKYVLPCHRKKEPEKNIETEEVKILYPSRLPQKNNETVPGITTAQTKSNITATGKYISPAMKLKLLEAKTTEQKKLSPVETLFQRVSGNSNNNKTDQANDASKDAIEESKKKKKEELEKKKKEREELEKQKQLESEKLFSHDPEAIQKFSDSIANIFEEAVNTTSYIDELKHLLGDGIKSIVPSVIVAANIFSHCHKTTDEMDVISSVKIIKPLLEVLFEESGIEYHKLHFLRESVKTASAIKSPRLSPSWALIEAFWYSLYTLDIVEEKYFLMWFGDSDDETTGRFEVMFQVIPFLEWIQTSTEMNVEENEAQEAESDIEALVPKRFANSTKRSKKKITRLL